MDDIFLQCNKNTIYVLNSSYAYGEFGRLNLLAGANNFENTTTHNGYLNNATSCSSSLTSLNNNAAFLTTSSKSKTSAKTAIPKFFHYSSCFDEKPQGRLTENDQNLTKCKNNSKSMTSGCRSTSLSSTACSAASSLSSKKATSALKSNIIAKKTKFWKYLEEEEEKSKNSIENLSTTNCERNSSIENNISTTSANTISGTAPRSQNSTNNNNISSSSHNYWGGITATTTTSDTSHLKSSAELYREAAQLLGLSCTLCDNCRCLDCQSRYFECDDSDTYSEISFMEEYYDTLLDQSPEILYNHHVSLTATMATTTTPSTSMFLHSGSSGGSITAHEGCTHSSHAGNETERRIANITFNRNNEPANYEESLSDLSLENDTFQQKGDSETRHGHYSED